MKKFFLVAPQLDNIIFQFNVSLSVCWFLCLSIYPCMQPATVWLPMLFFFSFFASKRMAFMIEDTILQQIYQIFWGTQKNSRTRLPFNDVHTRMYVGLQLMVCIVIWKNINSCDEIYFFSEDGVAVK